MDDSARIAPVDDVPSDTTLLFRVRDVESGDEREAVLVALADGVAAWLNYCQHFTHITLDKGSGAEMRDGEIVCTNHGAFFEADTGLCTFGPCDGAVLTEVSVAADSGDVYLTDDDYAFVGTGPSERDDLDRSSTSNFEY